MTPPDGAVQGAIHIADCLAHAVRWEGVFGCNLLIGFVCFDPVEPGEGVGDIAQERAVDGFRGVAQNELGLDAALLFIGLFREVLITVLHDAERVISQIEGSRVL